MSSVWKNQTTENVTNKKQIIVDFAWWMKKKALADQTIESRTSILRTLINRQVNINDPESVIEYLASSDNTESRKLNIVHTITCYLESQNISCARYASTE